MPSISPPLRLRRHARGHDYVAAEEVFAFLDHLAGVEAHAHATSPARRRRSPSPGAAPPLVPGASGALAWLRSASAFWIAAAHSSALRADWNATMNPSPSLFTSKPPCGLDLLADDGVVLAQHLHELRVAEAVGHRGGAFDVAEHDRDGAVGRGVRLQVRLLRERLARDGVDGGADVARGRCPAPSASVARHSSSDRRHAQRFRGIERLASAAERLLAVTRAVASRSILHTRYCVHQGGRALRPFGRSSPTPLRSVALRLPSAPSWRRAWPGSVRRSIAVDDGADDWASVANRVRSFRTGLQRAPCHRGPAQSSARQDHRDRPVAIPRDDGEVVFSEVLELTPGFLHVVNLE